MMAETIVIAIANALKQVDIPHMAVGAFVGIYYGMNRTTDDADFVIQVDDLKLTPLRQALGPQFIIDSQPRIENVTLSTYYVVNHPESDFGIDLFILRDDPHERLSLSRRRLIQYEAGETYICTAEDFVITKLRWAKTKLRSKDSEDARAVLTVQRDRLDLAYVRHWCDQHGTRTMLEDALRKLPPLPPL